MRWSSPQFRRSGTAPHAVRFSGTHGPVQAGRLYRTGTADTPYLFDELVWSAIPGEREEQIRVGVLAGGLGGPAQGAAGEVICHGCHLRKRQMWSAGASVVW